jgi:hypothetical protein
VFWDEWNELLTSEYDRLEPLNGREQNLLETSEHRGVPLQFAVEGYRWYGGGGGMYGGGSGTYGGSGVGPVRDTAPPVNSNVRIECCYMMGGLGTGNGHGGFGSPGIMQLNLRHVGSPHRGHGSGS